MVRPRCEPTGAGQERENRVVDIFDEVEEDLRAERAARLLREYAWLIIAVAVAVVGAAVGWQLWARWQTSRDMQAAQHYVTATAQADSASPAAKASAIAALVQQAATAPEGYRTLSRLRAAGLKADAGDIASAAALLDQVAADASADPLLRDLADLESAQRQLDHGDPAMLEARLKPLAAPGNPWAPLAREQLALLDLRQGKAADAKAALKALSTDIVAPNGLRQRVAAILAGLDGTGLDAAGLGAK